MDSPVRAQDSAGLRDYLDEHFRGQSPTTPDARSGTPEWTLFVNLAVNEKLQNSSLRMDSKLQEEALTELTKGKPIKIIVQTTLNDDPKLNGLGFSDTTVDAFPRQSQPDQTSVVRYEIHDGQKTLLGFGKSQGYTQNLSDLFSSDPAASKARHLGWINFSHGDFSGLIGDAGFTKLPELRSTVANFLKSSGHNKFDFVDLDSCYMGSAETMTELAPLAKYAFASEPTGSIDTRFSENGQPIDEIVKHLTSDASAPVGDFRSTVPNSVMDQCREHIARAKAATDDSHTLDCSTPHLGSYNLENSSLPDRLNSLGRALLAATKIPGNTEALDKIVASVPILERNDDMQVGNGRIFADQHRDLGMLLNAIDLGLKTHVLKDDPRVNIADAVSQLRQSLGNLVDHQFDSLNMDPQIKPERQEHGLPDYPLSGLNVFAPAPGEFSPNDRDHRIEKLFGKFYSVPELADWNAFSFWLMNH